MLKIFLQLGRNGDEILLLPLLKHIADTDGEKPVVIVSKQYASVFDGVSYVQPDVLDVDWFNGFQEANRYAWSKYGQVCVTQQCAPNMPTVKTVPTFGEAMWGDAMCLSLYGKLPMVFDRRDRKREERLLSRFTHHKPILLYNFTGVSSPFPYQREVYATMTRYGRDFLLVDIGKIKAERIYDLLALYDVAAGLVTIDTATLHLAAASKVPMFAYTVDGWNSAVPQGNNCKHNIKYSMATRQLTTLRDFIGGLSRGIQLSKNVSVRGKREREIIVRRTAAIGDALCATVVASRLKEIGCKVIFQCHGDIHPVIRRCPDIAEVRIPQSGPPTINLDGAYERHQGRKHLHFHEMFYRAANLQLQRQRLEMGVPMNCRPRMVLKPEDFVKDQDKFEGYPKPWVFIVPRSDSWIVRTIPDSVWDEAVRKMSGTKFWLGRHPAPKIDGLVDLECRNIEDLIIWLAKADLLVTPDTGPMHIAAALGIPVIAITQSSRPELHLNDQNDFSTIEPALDCLGCMEHVCPKNKHVPPCQHVIPNAIADEVNRRIAAQEHDWISAIVPIYQPNPKVLNRCLECLLPQVNEIIVASEAKSIIPTGVISNPKIRFVKTKRSGIGFSGNANHGARNSRGKWLLFCNDDAFLDPEAVKRMRDVAQDDTGIVSNLLRYPDGTIYHAGKTREKGVRGWGHIDHKKRVPTFKEVTELENCCGCVVLTPRKVFYDAGCYDEEMKIFAQDDAYALSVRRLGYKVLFNPHSTGVHQEHASVSKLGNMGIHVADANRVFGRKWGGYLDHNSDRIPGNFDYLHSQ